MEDQVQEENQEPQDHVRIFHDDGRSFPIPAILRIPINLPERIWIRYIKRRQTLNRVDSHSGFDINRQHLLCRMHHFRHCFKLL